MKYLISFILSIFSICAYSNIEPNPEQYLTGIWKGKDSDDKLNWESCVTLSEGGKLKMAIKIYDNENKAKPINLVNEGSWLVQNNHYVLKMKMTSYQGIEVHDDLRTENYEIVYLKKDIFKYKLSDSNEKTFVLIKVHGC